MLMMLDDECKHQHFALVIRLVDADETIDLVSSKSLMPKSFKVVKLGDDEIQPEILFSQQFECLVVYMLCDIADCNTVVLSVGVTVLRSVERIALVKVSRTDPLVLDVLMIIFSPREPVEIRSWFDILNPN
uniref:PITH domain-containing protein n=1 Tax=Heterorhabditis bacteriophora TaxID=37862 RepID=A0A1I7XL71_HETBA